MKLLSIKSIALFLLISLLLLLPVMSGCGSNEGGSNTQSTLPALSGMLRDTYDDPIILEYYQRVNQAWVDSGMDITDLFIKAAKCIQGVAAPVEGPKGVLDCTNAFYSTLTTTISLGQEWGSITNLYNEVKHLQQQNGLPVLHLDKTIYPSINDDYRVFYSWNDVNDPAARAALDPVLGKVTSIDQLNAAPFGEFARLTSRFYEGQMQTVIVNVNPMFLDTVPDFQTAPPTPTLTPTPTPTPTPSPASSEFKVDSATVALWHFNESAGTIVHDASGNSHDGTIVGATWVDQGLGGHALDFGTGKYVTVPDGTGLDGMYALTIEAWIYLRSYPPVFAPIVAKWGPGFVGDDSYKLYVTSTGQLAFDMCDGTNPGVTGSALIYSTDLVPLNEWTLVKGTWKKPGEVHLFINELESEGIPWDPNAQQKNIIQNTSQSVWIGYEVTGGDNWFNGMIDEVRISNVAR